MTRLGNNAKTLSQITDWIEESNTFSYYDSLSYAYNNDLHDWIKCLKQKSSKEFLSNYLKSRKQKDKALYNDSSDEAYNRMKEAKEEYIKRNASEEQKEWFD